MANPHKQCFLSGLTARVGALRKLPNSQSLFETNQGSVRLYVRYSKRHTDGRTFFGLRKKDLIALEGRRAFLCFIWDDQKEPLIVPFDSYESLFQSISPAADGQYKVQVLSGRNGVELYVAGCGRYNVEVHLGWHRLLDAVEHTERIVPTLSHSKVQALLAVIGTAKGHSVWVPNNDRGQLAQESALPLDLVSTLPPETREVQAVAEQIDVIWLVRGSLRLRALYEVEHSTTIYSGLLRFNDVHLIAPALNPHYCIVASEVRRASFARHLNRPTFRASGLHEICGFLEYGDVYGWYERMQGT